MCLRINVFSVSQCFLISVIMYLLFLTLQKNYGHQIPLGCFNTKIIIQTKHQTDSSHYHNAKQDLTQELNLFNQYITNQFYTLKLIKKFNRWGNLLLVLLIITNTVQQIFLMSPRYYKCQTFKL